MTDEQLATLESLGLAAIAELRRLREENARLKARLEAQINQSVRLSLELMALKAQRRDEEAPEYVTKEAA